MAYPVRMMTSVSGCAFRAAERTASPSAPGILRSVTTRSYSASAMRERAAAPSEAVSTTCPARASTEARFSRVTSSSSTRRIRLADASARMPPVLFPTLGFSPGRQTDRKGASLPDLALNQDGPAVPPDNPVGKRTIPARFLP